MINSVPAAPALVAWADWPNRLVDVAHSHLKTWTRYDDATAWPHHLGKIAARHRRATVEGSRLPGRHQLTLPPRPPEGVSFSRCGRIGILDLC